MAKKRSKKRKVRRKARRKTRKTRKGRKSRSRARKGRRGRRRNPGNFVKPAPAVAKRHLAKWAKQGVNIASQIGTIIGMKAPWGAKLESADEIKIAKIRFTEALQISNMYDLACEKIKATKKVVGAFKCPINASSVAKYIGTGGNFQPVTVKRATNYLKRIFRWSPRLHAKDAAGKTDYTRFAVGGGAGVAGISAAQLANLAGKSANGWLRGTGRRGDINPRLQEAMIVVGADKAETLLTDAKTNAVKYAKKEAVKAAKKAAAKAKRDAKALEKIKKAEAAAKARLQKTLDKLAAQRKKLTQATATAARAMKAAKAKRARKGRKKARRSMKRKAKKSKRKSRSKMKRRAKKSKRKSRRKSRRRR